MNLVNINVHKRTVSNKRHTHTRMGEKQLLKPKLSSTACNEKKLRRVGLLRLHPLCALLKMVHSAPCRCLKSKLMEFHLPKL